MFGPPESDLCYLSSDGISWQPIGEGTDIAYDVAVRARIVPEEISGWPDIYEMMLRDQQKSTLPLLRRYRDEVLMSHPQGIKHVDFIYKNSYEIAALFLKNPSLIADAGALIYKLLPAIRDSLKGAPLSLSRGELDSIESFLIRFETEAGPELKRGARKVSMDLRRGKMRGQMGIFLKR